MIKKTRIILWLMVFFFWVQPNISRSQGVATKEVFRLQESAHQYLERKDFSNAILTLSQAIRLSPHDVVLRRDLAYAYYLSGDAAKAKEVIEPVVNSDVADEQTFQIAAAIENIVGKNRNGARKLLQKGLKKFPRSGLLYNDLGNWYLSTKEEKRAFETWEMGVEMAPDYSLNYYSLAKVYQNKKDYVWALIYGETYVNMDNDPAKSNEIKKVLINAYQNLLSLGAREGLPEFRASKKSSSSGRITGFSDRYEQVLSQNATAISSGITVENLTMMRIRFLMEWQTKYARRYPMSLLTWQEALAHEGLYDAYNQWLFGAILNSSEFQLWLKKYGTVFSKFENWKRQHPYAPNNRDPKPEK